MVPWQLKLGSWPHLRPKLVTSTKKKIAGISEQSEILLIRVIIIAAGLLKVSALILKV